MNSCCIFRRILATSLSHDVTLANGQSTRSPKIDVFLNEIRKRLQEVIHTYEKDSIDRSDEVEEIGAQSHKALAFIESGNIDIEDNFFHLVFFD